MFYICAIDIVILCFARERIILVQSLVYIDELCMTLISISKIYFHHGFETGKLSLLFHIGIPIFGIWVYQHKTKCCVHMNSTFDLYVGGGGTLSEYNSQFLSCYLCSAFTAIEKWEFFGVPHLL